ncbi:RNA polymerase sigma factor [Ulvibacterium marinum]|uniref:Sigma-70 family RNA polymerase sigma factor n=1 Tax=Ulvibacterium marinum TaxID=2419782 RepID=A0A3B0BWU3_9FLAO|nr:sigma-70 family RNA polymerase sigma factor [Ulvibacterium marinum]RKN77895.1 sigma-70 family RNA polymerase sigma factor [Ulvibacterium marinum]
MNTLKKDINNEHGLWTSFLDGNKVAFATIYTRHVDALYSYGFKICPNTDLVKDSIQDVFIDLFQHREQLSKPSNIKFYLFKVLKHTVFRKLRKERKFGELSEQTLGLFQTEYSIEKKTILNEIERNRSLLIHKTLAQLSSKQREILYLRFTMGFSYTEISEIVTIDHNSVRKQVYRAIKKLRECDHFKNNECILLFYQLY